MQQVRAGGCRASGEEKPAAERCEPSSFPEVAEMPVLLCTREATTRLSRERDAAGGLLRVTGLNSE